MSADPGTKTPETSFVPRPERGGPWRSLLVPLLAFVTALAIGALIIIFSDPEVLDAWGRFFSDPMEALQRSGRVVADAYRALFTGSLGSPLKIFDAFRSGEVAQIEAAFRPLSETIVAATPFIFTGLAVALGFRAGLFNIGAEGQMNAGAITAAFVGFSITGLPIYVHLPLAIVAGFVGGAIWGMIPGILKARTGAHEVITTIMMNFIALRLLDYLLLRQPFQRPDRPDPISKVVEPSAELPGIPGSSLRVHLGILLALAAAYGVWWLLFRTTKGFEFRAVGSNPAAARYAGIGVGATYVLAMALAGGLGGLGGASQLLGLQKYLSGGFASGIGFTAIALALLGKAHPLGVVGASFLFGMLQAGSTAMQAATSTPVDIIVVIQALIIVFIAAPALVRTIWRIRAPRELGAEAFTKGWGA
ncbi:MAG TPA: ABC transporter permease [Actinomycetota bacterium]